MARQLRVAQEFEVKRMKQIERNGWMDLATGELLNQQYQKAVEDFEAALRLTSKTEEPLEWAHLQALLGICRLVASYNRCQGASRAHHPLWLINHGDPIGNTAAGCFPESNGHKHNQPQN
jgi:hypothetical protein